MPSPPPPEGARLLPLIDVLLLPPIDMLLPPPIDMLLPPPTEVADVENPLQMTTEER